MSEPPMSEPEVIVRLEGPLGRLSLNRPQALGALTAGMVRLMTDALLAWRDDGAVKAVLIDHTGERGFCAGGDIRYLADSVAVGGEAAKRFFFTEYQLNHLMKVYPKPIITVMDGITMGGGVGITLPARYRIATERTTFATSRMSATSRRSSGASSISSTLRSRSDQSTNPSPVSGAR